MTRKPLSANGVSWCDGSPLYRGPRRETGPRLDAQHRRARPQLPASSAFAFVDEQACGRRHLRRPQLVRGERVERRSELARNRDGSETARIVDKRDFRFLSRLA